MALRSSQLRYFVAVADEGQIPRAAAKLHLALHTVTQAIANLESELGFTVLERHARGVKLTPAGERFLIKARQALEAEMDAAQTAQWLARVARGTIEFGFVGVPPGLDSPGPMSRFAETHPEIDLRYRELPFPGRSTSDWLSEVDIAVTHVPPPDENIWTQVVRSEPRAVLVPRSHHLADRSQLSVAEVLDEAFIGYSDEVDPAWAGFWSLDDHRGGPPPQVTTDQAAGPQEVLAALAVRDAITTVPASSAAVLVNFLTRLTSIPLTDADPTTFVLTGRRDRDNPLVQRYREFATGPLGLGAADGPPAEGERHVDLDVAE